MMKAREKALITIRAYSLTEKKARAIQTGDKPNSNASNTPPALEAEKTLKLDETLINQMVEHSVLPQNKGDLFAVMPVRSFRANGNEVKSLTITASPSGQVSLHDLSGNMIVNTTLNATLGYADN
jgi:hypothetical protein